MLMPVAIEVFVDTTLGNMWANRTPRRISRTGVDGSIPIYTPINSGMRKSSTPDSSDSNGTRITIGTGDNTTTPTYGLNVRPKIENIRQSTTSYLRNSNKSDAAIDGKFPNNMVALPILNDVLCENFLTVPARISTCAVA